MDISSSSDTSNNRSTSNVLNLPFEVTENVEVINTTKHFFDNLLTLEWEKTETFEEYLHKIHQHENVYFDIKNYDEIALNKLTLKQLMDLKIKIKEHIYNVNLLNEKRNILNDMQAMFKSHKLQIFQYNTYFKTKVEECDRTYCDNYIRFLNKIFHENNYVCAPNHLHRYAIKTNIEFELELGRTEEIYYHWKQYTYEDIEQYYEFN
jgi:hypothetical protein